MVGFAAPLRVGAIQNGYMVCGSSRWKDINLDVAIQHTLSMLNSPVFVMKFNKLLRMKNTFGTLSRVLLIMLIFTFSHCAPWDKSDVRIERFEYLDVYHRTTPEGGDSISSEAYLIHGYNSKHEDEIHEITDRYVCDSIIPYKMFHRRKYITFFKKTKNTNRENFQVKPKHKIIRARTHDKVLSYVFTVRDSVITRMRKQPYYNPYEPLPPSPVFHCD